MSKRRASKRKRRKGKVPPHLRKYLFKSKRRRKHGRRAHKHMARKRRRSHRRHYSKRRRRSGGGGGARGWIPPREDLHLYAAAAGIGYLESMAAADANHVLNKLPRPVAQLGYTGGTALAAWVIARLTGNRWARLIARGAAAAASYQMGRHGGLFADSSKAVQMSGEDYLGDGTEHIIDDHVMGALDAEGESVDGLPWESEVEDADVHV